MDLEQWRAGPTNGYNTAVAATRLRLDRRAAATLDCIAEPCTDLAELVIGCFPNLGVVATRAFSDSLADAEHDRWRAFDGTRGNCSNWFQLGVPVITTLLPAGHRMLHFDRFRRGSELW